MRVNHSWFAVALPTIFIVTGGVNGIPNGRNDVINCLKNRRNHVVNGIENRAEKVVDRCKNGGEEISNRCKYSCCHRLNGSDNGGEGIGNGRPGVDEKVPDSGNNSREE